MTDAAVGGGFDGPCVASYSSDGKNWITNEIRDQGPLFAIAYGNGVFVAAGAINSLLYSLDGINWSNAIYSIPFLHTFMDVCFGDGQFVAVGFEPAGARHNFLYTSTNGIYWRLQQDGAIFPYLRRLLFEEGHFFAVGDEGAILKSSYAGWPRLSINRFAASLALELCISAQEGSSY